MKPTWKIVTHGPSRAFLCHKFHDPEAGAGVAPLGDLEEARKRVNERSS
jgi:hypothetical protein